LEHKELKMLLWDTTITKNRKKKEISSQCCCQITKMTLLAVESRFRKKQVFEEFFFIHL